ncbi:MAG TPA: CoA-binding protein [Acidobacteriota bacterium]|nr:CoA-binding protein [Acidobacteriota bacterium]
MSANTSKALVDDFVAQKAFAVVGVSQNPRKFGNLAYRELKLRGYRLFPVNPNLEKMGEDHCYPTLKSIPEKVGGVLIIVPPKETEKIVKEADEAGIKHVWMQQGAESETAIKYCEEHGLKEVHGECILMFTQPVKSYHKLHRGITRLFGNFPK